MFLGGVPAGFILHYYWFLSHLHFLSFPSPSMRVGACALRLISHMLHPRVCAAACSHRLDSNFADLAVCVISQSVIPPEPSLRLTLKATCHSPALRTFCVAL